MPVVSFVELGREADRSADGARCKRVFAVTNHTGKKGPQHLLHTIPTTPPELMNDLRWYLEDFVVLSPLETKRADRIKQSLKDAGRAIINSVKWAAIVGPEERKESLIISVQEQPCGSAPVLWELLEDSELWDDPFKGGVFVSRHSQKPEKSPTSTAHGNRPDRVSPSLNILIVAARPRKEKDIPHRIVSKILHDKIRKQRDQLMSPTYLKVLRPPTWEEFKRELESKGVGFYDIVHFDMHGVKMSDSRQGLAFVDTAQDKAGGYGGAKGVPTSDVASVLALHGVRRVVLNACRSAQFQDADQSIALGILKTGIEECIAMTFNVVSRVVEIFMSIFYDAILTKGLAFDAAAAWARQALRLMPARNSRYATSVDVYDYMIPICYTTAVPQSSDAYTFTGRSLQFPRRSPFNDVVGREGDILSLETEILVSKKALWLLGRPGVGKTALLRHLGSWWQETGLAIGVYLYDCHASLSWGAEKFWLGAHSMFLPNEDYQSSKPVIGYLRKTRCVVILDNLPPSPGRQCLRFVSQILGDLDGGNTKVIFATRSVAEWESLGEYFEPERVKALRGLKKIDSLRLLRTYMKKAIEDITGQPAKSVGESPEDLHCFEQIAMLLDGNPVALRVAVASFLYSRATTMKEFLSDLILGEPLMESEAAQQHLTSMGQAEDLPCVTELNSIIQSLTTPPAGQYAVPVEVLALFWGLMPRSDLHLFISAYSDNVSKDLPLGTFEDRVAIFRALSGQAGAGMPDWSNLPPEFKSALAEMTTPGSFLQSREIQELMTTMTNSPRRQNIEVGQRGHFLLKDSADWADIVKQSPLFSLYTSACSRIIKPLKTAQFIADSGWGLPSDSTRHYRTHPLLPLLLRASPLYHLNEGAGIKTVHIKQAHVFYYAYRARAWPFEHQYFEPQWQSVREELESEFVNFVSAGAIYGDIGKDMPNVTHLSLVPLQMVMVLQRGIGTESSRLQLVHIAQDRALAFVLHHETRLSDPAVTNPKKDEILFMLRMYGTILAGGRRAFGASLNAEERKQFAALSGSLAQRMKQMGSQFVNRMWAEAEVTPTTLRYADHHLEMMSDSADPSNKVVSDAAMDESWKLRQDFMKERAALTGDTSYASHKTWRDIPVDSMSGGMHKQDKIRSLEQANNAIDRGQLDEARTIVDDAWEREVLYRSEDRLYRAQLLEMRAAICERDGDWETGAEHRGEAKQIRRILGAETPAHVLGVLDAVVQMRGIFLVIAVAVVSIWQGVRRS